mgnify:CR=1 FL=1
MAIYESVNQTISNKAALYAKKKKEEERKRVQKIENMSAGQLAYETRRAECKGYSSLDSWLVEKLITIPDAEREMIAGLPRPVNTRRSPRRKFKVFGILHNFFRKTRRMSRCSSV